MQVLTEAAKELAEIGEIFEKTAEAFIELLFLLVVNLLNFQFILAFDDLVSLALLGIPFTIGLILLPLVIFGNALAITTIVVAWIISNLIGAVPLLAAPLLGVLAAGVAPAVAGVAGVAGLAAMPAAGVVAAPAAVAVGAVEPLAGGASGARLVSVVASDRGAGVLGFAGTAGKEAVAAPCGLTVLAGDGLGGGVRVPMLPASWEPNVVGAVC
ncbi:PPW family C-terminal domain-containing PPE protein [Mycobacterium lacus]|nr:hypothetical protein [Mycobacterium lacus]MCV7121876.1 hypothetical protein [Mycobacterium lacus]